MMLAQIFEDARKRWKGNGSGSTDTKTQMIRAVLPELVKKYDIKSIVDYGCGVPSWILVTATLVDSYIGIDVVPDIIEENRKEFPGLDFLLLHDVIDDIPKADLVIARDVFAHLPNESILQVLRKIKESGSTYLLATTKHAQKANLNVKTGDFRPLNLERRPFNLPMPRELIAEGYEGKHLGLWRLGEI